MEEHARTYSININAIVEQNGDRANGYFRLGVVAERQQKKNWLIRKPKDDCEGSAHFTLCLCRCRACGTVEKGIGNGVLTGSECSNLHLSLMHFANNVTLQVCSSQVQNHYKFTKLIFTEREYDLSLSLSEQLEQLILADRY